MRNPALRSLLFLCVLCGSSSVLAQAPAYLNTNLSFEERARDLVSRMTLEEKATQMIDNAVAIPRLGVPEYGWWNEGLHGVARAGLATSFPQAIGMAATWNDQLMFDFASVTSVEARAKHHDYARRGERRRYQGLTYWSPNINIFRDPRWGRGQETYGEDPFLTGQLGVQFIRGLQGDDPKYFRTVATVKHFAVHSGPEPERHVFDAIATERDFRETYLPHFERGIREGGAYSLMCAYNRVYGATACGSDLLIRTILRGEWGFQGFIVSDCGAIDDMYLRHKVVETASQAAALGVKTGTDLDCGRVYPNLVQAVRNGEITEAQIDTSLVRLMLGRMRLGMFDPDSIVPWAKIAIDTLDSPTHKALALRAAHESIVLLKNANNTLPLRRTLGSIAVIGPNIDDWRMLLGNYNGIPSDPITPLRGIREKVGPGTRVLSAIGSDLAEGFPVYQPAPSAVLRAANGAPGLDVTYYRGHAVADSLAVGSAVVTAVGGQWGEGAPVPGVHPDSFAVRYTATLRVPRTGAYRLGLVGTLRYSLWLDDSLYAQSRYFGTNEYPDPRQQQSPALTLEAGRDYRLRIDGVETYGQADLQMVWSQPAEALQAEALRVAGEADAVVLFLGLTARLEGEEMPIQVPGFRGGDRTSIDLPAPQRQLMERVAALGKPTVVVLMTGSAIAVNWAQDHVPAILNAWYPGQAGGTAIADVLFGDYNPAGRLPVTFYRGVADMPAFDDYAMEGRTYRFYRGTPLYAFGHGLSYTTFRYSKLKSNFWSVRSDDSITVRFNVTNTGTVAGDEVPQLYVRHTGAAVSRPIKDLRGYTRIHLRPGETRTVTFKVPVNSLAYWDENADRWVVENERVELQVGPSSDVVALRRMVKVKP